MEFKNPEDEIDEEMKKLAEKRKAVFATLNMKNDQRDNQEKKEDILIDDVSAEPKNDKNNEVIGEEIEKNASPRKRVLDILKDISPHKIDLREGDELYLEAQGLTAGLIKEYQDAGDDVAKKVEIVEKFKKSEEYKNFVEKLKNRNSTEQKPAEQNFDKFGRGYFDDLEAAAIGGYRQYDIGQKTEEPKDGNSDDKYDKTPKTASVVSGIVGAGLADVKLAGEIEDDEAEELERMRRVNAVEGARDDFGNIRPKQEKESEKDGHNTELERLQNEVEEARKKYAKADYDESKITSQFKRIFGRKSFQLKIDTRVEAFKEYKKRLAELSQYEIEKLREENLKGEEIETKINELVKYFDTDEKMRLYADGTNARTEDWKGRIGGELMKKSGEFVNWYRKQNPWAKGAIGVALASTGIVAAHLGAGAVVAGVGAASMAKRVLGGAAVGMGTTATLEANYRIKEKNKTEKERIGFVRQLEGKEAGEKLDLLKWKLNAEMNAYHKSLTREQLNAELRTFTGIATGMFVSSGAMGELLGKFVHWVEGTDTFKYVADSEVIKTATSFWKEKLGHFLVHSASGLSAHSAVENATDAKNPPINVGSNHFAEVNQGSASVPAHSMSEVPEHQGNMAEKNVENHKIEADRIDLEVQEGRGGSIEGSIIKHLKSTGMSSHDAGAQAHRMALAYAEEHKLGGGPYNLIHAGAHIELGADENGELKILEISGDKHLGYLHHNEVINTDAKSSSINAGSKHSLEANQGDVLTNSNFTNEVKSNYQGNPVHEAIKNNANVPKDYMYLSKEINDLTQDLQEEKKKIFQMYPDIKSMTDFRDRVEELRGQMLRDGVFKNNVTPEENLARSIEFNNLDMFHTHIVNVYIKTMRSMMGFEGSFGDNSDLDLDAAKYLAENGDSKFGKIMASLKGKIGEEKMQEYGLNPRPGDKVINLLQRVVNYRLKGVIL